jgi:hypothetical protein
MQYPETITEGFLPDISIIGEAVLIGCGIAKMLLFEIYVTQTTVCYSKSLNVNLSPFILSCMHNLLEEGIEFPGKRHKNSNLLCYYFRVSVDFNG